MVLFAKSDNPILRSCWCPVIKTGDFCASQYLHEIGGNLSDSALWSVKGSSWRLANFCRSLPLCVSGSWRTTSAPQLLQLTRCSELSSLLMSSPYTPRHTHTLRISYFIYLFGGASWEAVTPLSLTFFPIFHLLSSNPFFPAALRQLNSSLKLLGQLFLRSG